MRQLIGILILGILFSGCHSSKTSGGESVTKEYCQQIAEELNESLDTYILNTWYPRCIDSISGGFSTNFSYNWIPDTIKTQKVLVHQARHTWTTARVYECFPEKTEFLQYSTHGYRFLRDNLWDGEYGGFFSYCNIQGKPDLSDTVVKRIYGTAFAIYALSQYYKVTHDPEALNLVQKAFTWTEEHGYDRDHGGYFEEFTREGNPVTGPSGDGEFLPSRGLKEANSTIHMMEALTALYEIWPDDLVKRRLEEIFLLVLDTVAHPDGFLNLYFYPDWTVVPDSIMDIVSNGNVWFTQHYSFGHDVETAYLLLETGRALGIPSDKTTHSIAKKMVDHSLDKGWDNHKGGFYYMGRKSSEGTEIINAHKSYWTEAEGMNALLLMNTIYPDDPRDYFNLFLETWQYTDLYLVDKEYGGWYNYGIDNYPENQLQDKSHAWKANYHNVRAIVNCIEGLREQ